jgi:hypothetical protein
MFDKFASRRSSFESDKSSLKGRLRALVNPKQASGPFTVLNDSQSVHSDSWSLSSTDRSRSGTSPSGWASSSHTLSTPPQAHVAGWPASSSPPPRLPLIPMVSTPRPKFYTHSSAKSTHSLRLDPRYYASGPVPYTDDPYLHPGVKQLSPIAEQDHFSPERRSLPLPSSSERDITITSSQLYNSSPDGSELTRQCPLT